MAEESKDPKTTEFGKYQQKVPINSDNFQNEEEPQVSSEEIGLKEKFGLKPTDRFYFHL